MEEVNDTPKRKSKARAPRKRAAPKQQHPINIQKISELRLLDSKIIPANKPGNRTNQILAGSIILGFLAGLGVLAYLFWVPDKTVTPQDLQPQISVPEVSVPTSTEETAAPEPAPATEAVPEVKKVHILATPTGFLNVRTGPGTTYAKIGQVRPGEVYDLVSENSEKTWYEIKLTGGTGWIIKQYAEVR